MLSSISAVAQFVLAYYVSLSLSHLFVPVAVDYKPLDQTARLLT